MITQCSSGKSRHDYVLKGSVDPLRLVLHNCIVTSFVPIEGTIGHHIELPPGHKHQEVLTPLTSAPPLESRLAVTHIT